MKTENDWPSRDTRLYQLATVSFDVEVYHIGALAVTRRFCKFCESA